MEKVDQTRMTLGDYFVYLKHSRHTKLDDIDKIIDWKPIEKLLKKYISRKINAVGNPAYPPMIMFRCLLLQRLYDLSDVQLEENLYDRISFLRFVGLGIEDDIPDASTICRFRNSLLPNDLVKKLFNEVLEQFQRKGLCLSKGIAVDATVIQSARHPRAVIENVPEDRNEPDLHEELPPSSDEQAEKVRYSDDSDAAWIKKAGRYHYGYKAHVASDTESGILLGGHLTPANRSDMNELKKVLHEVPFQKGARCFTDRGYASKKNREEIQSLGMKDGIMNKGARGRSLTHWEQIRNKLISRSRCIIERLFGNLKKNFGFSRSRYVGLAKVEQEFFLVSLSANLCRAVTLAAAR